MNDIIVASTGNIYAGLWYPRPARHRALVSSGFIAIPEGPGIGVRLVEDVLAKVTQGIERLYP